MTGEKIGSTRIGEVSPGEGLEESSVNEVLDSQFDSFKNERNINDKTGKERSFSDFDIYPKQKGETNEEYSARLKRIHEKEAEYLAKEAARTAILDENSLRTEHYLDSEQGKQELAEEEKYDRIQSKLEELVKKGAITEERARQLLERQLKASDEAISGIRQDYKDRQTVGTPEEDAAYEDWLKAHDAENEENLIKRQAATESGSEEQTIDHNPSGGRPFSPESPRSDDTEEKPDKDPAESGEKTREELEKERDAIDEEIATIDRILGKGEQEESDDEKESAIEKEAKEDRERRIRELEGELGKILPNLAELYARNRRLIVGAKNRAEFVKSKARYEELLDEYTRLKAKDAYETGWQENMDYVVERVEEAFEENEAKLIEFAGGDLENTEKTKEEIEAERLRLAEESEKAIRAEYEEKMRELETEVNVAFLKDYLAQQSKLEEATIDKLDNGTIYRKFVNKVLNNKFLKGALITAGIAGLAVTGVGLATGLAAGTVAVSLGYTAGGIAAGAAKGAFAGGLMSRQNSKNSAVRGFATEEEIKKKIEGIKAWDKNADTKNVASWLMEQYGKANDQDLHSNRKRTAISAGIGAALGGLMSGVHISDVSSSTQISRVKVGNEAVKIEPAKFGDVNIPKGGGAYNTFTQMGGDPSNMQKALDIMYKIDPKYGLAPGSNGETIGLSGAVGNFAHTYPGTIDTWPDVAQSYIREVAEEWARQGLIPSIQTGGAPIYNTVTNAVTDYIPNAFLNFLTRATSAIGAGAIGGVIGGRRNNTPSEQQTEEKRERAPITETTGEPKPANPETENSDQSEDWRNFISRHPDSYGGAEGISILTSESGPDDDKFKTWWDGLDETTKRNVRNTLDSIQRYSIEEGGPKWGRAFREWLMAQPS